MCCVLETSRWAELRQYAMHWHCVRWVREKGHKLVFAFILFGAGGEHYLDTPFCRRWCFCVMRFVPGERRPGLGVEVASSVV